MMLINSLSHLVQLLAHLPADALVDRAVHLLVGDGLEGAGGAVQQRVQGPAEDGPVLTIVAVGAQRRHPRQQTQAGKARSKRNEQYKASI